MQNWKVRGSWENFVLSQQQAHWICILCHVKPHRQYLKKHQKSWQKGTKTCRKLNMKGGHPHTTLRSSKFNYYYGLFVCREFWIIFWLLCAINRLLHLSNLGSSLKVKTTRGFLYGGVLSLLLWNIVLDGLLTRLGESGVFVQGYDLVTLVTGRFQHTVYELLSWVLMDVNKWCGEAGLTVNLAKVVLEPFKVQGTIIRPYK